MNNKQKPRKILKRFLIAVVALLLILAIAMGIYLSDYRSADETAESVMAQPSAEVTVEQTDDVITFVPQGEIRAGVIFYPGAKIRGGAYATLADSLAENGYLCILVNMPLNLATLDSDAAIKLMEDWPDVSSWYIAGHSMGGLAAEKCAYDNDGIFDGLIVLASRIQYDFSDRDIPVLAIYATNDGICTPERVAAADTPEPARYTRIDIDGGCHGYFGDYGQQPFDGTPSISREEQQEQTLEAILEFLE